MKKTLITVAKILLTIGIFWSLFAEFGGGTVAVSRAGFADGSIFYQANPARPGFVGRVKARLTGTTLPDPYVALPGDQVCALAIEGAAVFVRSEAGDIVKMRAPHHCVDGRLAQVLVGPDTKEKQPLAAATAATVWVEKQGVQRVPMTVDDLWAAVRALDLRVFVPWILFATFVKFLGILANIVRWQVLLAGQGLRFGFPWLTASYFIGRFFGIVMPSTLGLDGWRLYDTIRVSGKPVECTTVLAVERVIGLVGLLATILLFMPFSGLQGRDLADVVRAMAVPLAGALLFGLLLLLRPATFAPLVRLVPIAKVRRFLASTIQSATAYSSRRSALLIALLCAVFGQLTTMAMYFGNAMALQVQDVTMLQVFYAAAVMTLGTFITPTAAGEGVRELVFIELLGGTVGAAKAFLIGHIGFWIEKLLLSFQGGIFLIWAPKSYQRVTREELERLRADAERKRREQTGGAEVDAGATALAAAVRDAEAHDATRPPADVPGLFARLRTAGAAGLGAGLVAGLLIGLVETLVIAREGLGSEHQVLWYGPLAYGLLLGLGGLAGGLALGVLPIERRAIRGWTASLVLLALGVLPALGIALFRIRRDVFHEQMPPAPVLAGVFAVAGLVAVALFFFGPRLLGGRLARAFGALPALLLAALVVAGGAIAGRALYPSAPAAPAPPAVPAALADEPNLVLIVIDTLRADALSCYGGPVEAKNICGVAERDGTTYSGFSHASWTKPSFASILTSTLPSTHNTMSKTATLPQDLVLVSEALQQHGYATGGIVANINLAPSFGFQQGYDEYTYLSPDYLFGAEESSSKLVLYQIGRKLALQLKPGHRVTDYFQDAETVTGVANDWFDRHKDSRFFLLLHYMDPHDPYFERPYNGKAVARVTAEHPDPSQAARMRELYYGGIRFTDEYVGKVEAKLRELGIWDETMIVITADHGEEFQDHGGWWHGKTLYEEQIHVPLLVKWPKGKVGGPARVDDRPVRQIDIAPTLLTLAGAPIPTGMQGKDLAVPTVQRNDAERMHYAEEDHEGNVLRAIRTEDWKLIEANEGNPRGVAPVELFAIDRDRGEKTNLAAEKPEVADDMRRHAEAQRQVAASQAVESGEQAKLTKEECEKLRVLGYVENCDQVN